MTRLDENDTDAITELLMGRRIVSATRGTFNELFTDSWSPVTGRLTLDNGTEIYVRPNQGGCACDSGDYDLTHLVTVDNIITSVRLAEEGTGEYATDVSYRIYVVADATEINVMAVDGNDGNGYYGTGYELIVVRP